MSAPASPTASLLLTNCYDYFFTKGAKNGLQSGNVMADKIVHIEKMSYMQFNRAKELSEYCTKVLCSKTLTDPEIKKINDFQAVFFNFANVRQTLEPSVAESESMYNELLDKFDLTKATEFYSRYPDKPLDGNVGYKEFISDLIKAKSPNPPSPSISLQTPLQANFAKMRQTYNNPFESKYPPVGIRNQGNTCYAASLMQLVSMNTLLSGAYQYLLPKDHYARNAVHSYRVAQLMELSEKKPQEMKDIAQMREAFGGVNNKQQQDAVELIHKIHNDMKLPNDGLVEVENSAPVVFGHFLERFIVADNGLHCWQRFSVQKDSPVSFPMLDLQRTVQLDRPTLDNLIEHNLGEQGLYFSQTPNVLLLNICRSDGKTLEDQPVDLPLYYEIPKSRKKGSLKSEELFTLQGFLTHLPNGLYGKKGGHYIAYHQWNGEFYQANDGVINKISLQQYLDAAKTAYLPVYTKLTPR